MKLEYRIVEVAKGDTWNCNFCSYDKGKSSIASHEMVARKADKYADVAYICSDCKRDFDNSVLPWCEKCGRIKRNRISCFCKLMKEEESQPISEEEILAQAYSSRLEEKTKELEKEISTKDEEIATHLEALKVSGIWSKKQKQELLDEIKRLRARIKQLEEKNGQLITQIEVKK